MITLEQSKVGRADKVEQMVIDTFIRKSEVLELLPFANDVSPNGGSTLTYGYVQTKTPSTAAFRAIGKEYDPNEATVEDKAVKLAIFGGAFEIDRIIKTIEGQINNMTFQLEQKIEAAVGVFHNAMINGDTAVTADGFDGLDKFLVGTANELNTGVVIDLSTDAKITENASAFYEMLTKLLNDTSAHAIFCNADMKTKIQTVARKLGYQTQTEEAFGRKVTNIDGVRIIDLGNIYDASGAKTPIVNKVNRTVGGSEQTGLTDIFAVKFDIYDGFHGVSLTGDDVIQQYLPNFDDPGAVKKGEVEMVACVALKNANNAGVLRNIKIA